MHITCIEKEDSVAYCLQIQQVSAKVSSDLPLKEGAQIALEKATDSTGLIRQWKQDCRIQAHRHGVANATSR